MRIGIDARELTGHPTGVGRYLAELLACWSRDPAAAADTITLFSPVPITLPDGLLGSGGAQVSSIVVPGRPGVAWEQTRLGLAARRHGTDLLFCPAYSSPIVPLGLPTVVALHDLSFCAHPEWFRPRERWRRRLSAWAAAHHARRVLTISEFSREEIVRLLGVPRDRIDVTPLGAGGFFNPAPPHDDAAAASATGREAREPLVLYVGSIFNRRHLPTLLRAFTPIARDLPAARLSIVGDNRTYPYEDLQALVRQLGIAPHVHLAAFVSDEELASLYRRARAFAFLSTYEGFALTPLEAMAAGVPAVLFDTPVAREVFHDAALFVPVGDELAVTAALRALLEFESARTHCLTAAAPLVAAYTWPRTATATLDILRRAAALPAASPRQPRA